MKLKRSSITQVLQHLVLYVCGHVHLLFEPPTYSLSLRVSSREACAAIACMDAAATHYLGSRSPGSWRGERHPTPPRPLPRPGTLFWTPWRGRTWSSGSSLAFGVDLIWNLQPLPAVAETGAWSQMCPTKKKVHVDPGWTETIILKSHFTVKIIVTTFL